MNDLPNALAMEKISVETPEFDISEFRFKGDMRDFDANSFRMSVAFLVQANDNGERLPKASSFLVGVDMEGQYQELYLVTAQHNLEKCKKDRPLFARFNSIGESYIDQPIELSSWERHTIADVAICPFIPPRNSVLGYTPHTRLLTDEYLAATLLEEGSRIFMPALFSEFFGTNFMYPVVRSGSLALAPLSEEIYFDIGEGRAGRHRGYLIECLSWGGCSGAPVFVEHYDTDNEDLGDTPMLGLLCGHYDVKRKATDAENSNVEFVMPMNAGLAFVIPAQTILDLIMLEHFVQERTERYQKITRGGERV